MNNLKNVRRASGLTQKEFGKKLGLSMAGYRQKENGERNITLPEGFIMAKILNKSIHELFYFALFSIKKMER